MSDSLSIQNLFNNEYAKIQAKLSAAEIDMSFSEKLNVPKVKTVASDTENVAQPLTVNKTKSNQISNFPQSNSTKYVDIAEEMGKKYSVPTELIMKVIETESSFNPNAVSGAGAQGLMQLMPATARHLGVENPFDPKQNIEGGVKYLKEMVDRFGNWRLAVAAYNAGPGNVSKYGGVPPFTETQNYVKKILGN